MSLTPATKSGRYIGIKSDGLFHEKVDAGTEGAILREYELKDGTHGSKWELLYADIKDVLISKIEFEDSDYGLNVLTTFTDGDNEVIWAENVSTNFGTDWLKKLPNVNFAEKLTVKPYSFTDEKGKERKGVSVWQKSDKITDFFWDGEKKLHGFPEPENAETYDKDDWKVYFIQVRKFLVQYTKENVLPLFEKGIVYPENELDATDFPAF